MRVVMFVPLFAFAVTAATAAAAEQGVAAEPAAAVPRGTVRALEALPNVTIRYYDVAGANLPAIIASIADRAPKDPASNAVTPSSSDWSVNVSFEHKSLEGKCTITGARARFTASVLLPRLLSHQALTREERKVWAEYLGNLKANAAAELWFVSDRVGQIEKAIVTSSCETASQSAAAAAEKIKRDLAKFARLNKKRPPSFRVPVRDENDPRG